MQYTLEQKKELAEQMIIKLSELNYPLSGYQKKGANFLILFRRAVLNFSIGLGKTATAIAAAKTITDKYPGRFLVICPSSNKYTVWAEEIKKFLGEEYYTVVDGDLQTRQKQYKADSLFVISSYELLRRDTDLELILQFDWKGVIFDEITRIKNIHTKTYKAALKLQKYRYLFGLTGCSIENNVADIFAITSSVNPFVFGRYRDFKKQYLITEPMKVWNRQRARIVYLDKVVGHRNLDMLKEKLKYTFYIKSREDTDIAFSESQKLLYAVEPSIAEREMYNSIVELRKDSIFAAITMLKQACNFPRQIGFDLASSKAEELISLLEDIGEKVIIFTQYKRTLDLLTNILESTGREIITISGEESAKRKAEKLKQFRKATKDAILIATDCLSYGTNLQFCNVLINYDILWNPIAMEQRLGRIDRRGQKSKVVIINLIVKHSIEEKVWEVLTRKQELIKYLIGIEFGHYDEIDSDFVEWLVK